MRVDAWIRAPEARLTEAGIEGARLDATLLAAHALGQSRSWVLAHPEATVTDEADAMHDRRVAREPLAYIVGGREFYGRWFKVGPGALVPRPETETLIDAALGLDWTSVLDVGTGSGCLGITLALERPSLRAFASDWEPTALVWAQRNADRLGARVEFRLGDLLRPWQGMQFDLIVSNPPYVAPGAPLEPEIAAHEPASALYAEEDGHAVYRRFAREAAGFLTPGGHVILELGAGMRPTVEPDFVAQGWRVIECRPDLLGIDRALVLQAGQGIPRLP